MYITIAFKIYIGVKLLKIIIFFAITALAGYVLGYTVGHWTAEAEVEAARKEMDIDGDGDPLDELFK